MFCGQTVSVGLIVLGLRCYVDAVFAEILTGNICPDPGSGPGCCSKLKATLVSSLMSEALKPENFVRGAKGKGD